MPGLNQFKNLLGQMESGGNYQAVNSSSGALGKYQFLPATLTALQFEYNLTPWLDDYNFLNSPALQEVYLESHLQDMTDSIRSNNLTAYLGRRVTGSKRFTGLTTYVNIYGLLGAAHLSGVGNLRRYFNSGYDPDDGLTSLTDYLAYFSSSSGDTGFIFPLVALAFMFGIVLYYS